VTPVAVPIVVEGIFVGDDRVRDAIGGADGEVVTRAVIAVEIQHHVDAVDLFLEIALHALQGARRRRRVGIPERHRESIGRGQDPRFGGQRRRLTIERLHLAKVGDMPGALPFGGVDPPIDGRSSSEGVRRRGGQKQQT
jgi:hypothetical protein